VPNSKKKRKQKISKGINGGGGKVKLTTLQKALMGKGIIASAGPKSARHKTKVKAGR
jgi:hypothetical protein